jgi:hypothetical protein
VLEKIGRFREKIEILFSKTLNKPLRSNLSISQKQTLQWLQNSETTLVVKSDKNLGPVLVDRKEYLLQAFSHLLNEDIYTRLDETRALYRLQFLYADIDNFIKEYTGTMSEEDTKYLTTMYKKFNSETNNTLVCMAKFYLLFKLHKAPLATQPIVAVSGSILEGLGKWLDNQLQPICRSFPTFLGSSLDLVRDLRTRSQRWFCDNPSFHFVTADAISMYTNIDTDHALLEIARFLDSYPATRNLSSKAAIISALSIIMRNNIFWFGDTYFLQKSGTAMGAPPACMYATLYFFIHEKELIDRYRHAFLYYKRYIDDIFIVLDPTLSGFDTKQFQQELSFG